MKQKLRNRLHLCCTTIVCFFLSIAAYGQNISTYTYSQSIGTYTSITGTNLTTACADDNNYAVVTIPFTFVYHGANFTTLGVSANGYARLGATTSTYYSDVVAYLTNVLSPMNNDLYGCATNRRITYTTTGTSPNRIFIVEWFNWGFYSSGLNEFSFQLQLKETANSVNFVYGPTPGTTSASMTVGLSGAATTDFQQRTSSSSWTGTTAGGNFTYVPFNSSIKPPSGLTLTWSPPTACTGTPTAGTITPGSATYCGGTNQVLSLSGNTVGTGINYLWQLSTNGGSTWSNAGSTSSTLSTGNITSTTMYQCIITCTNSGLSATTPPVTFTVNPNPTLTLSPAYGAFICTTGGSATISASGTGTSYSWSPGTGLSSTTASTVTASPSVSTAYTVTSTLGPCSVSSMVPVSMATGPSITTTATPSNVCSGSNTQLATTQSPSGYQVYPIAPAVYTIPNAATIGFPSLDDDYSTLSIPFTFDFYGNSYTTVYVSTNGLVMFNTNGVYTYSPVAIPNSGDPNNYISPFWHDMNLANGGNVTYGVVGTSPYRKFIVSFNAVADYSAGGTNTGQVILYETSNYIDVVVSSSTGSTAKVLGIENSGGTDGAYGTNRNNTTWTIASTAPEAYRFTPTTYTYAWTPTTGLNSTTVYNPVRSNLTSSTTFSVTVTDPVTGCSTNGTAATTVSPLPVGSLLVTPDTICDAQSAVVTFTGTSGALAYFSQAGIPQSPIPLVGGVGTFNTPPLNVTTVYRLDSVIGMTGCKFISGATDTAFVNPRPTASISGTQTICNGSSAFIVVTVGMGVPPWTVTYSDGSNTYSQTSSNTSFAISVSPSVSTTYTLTNMVDAHCTSLSIDLTGSAVVTVNPRPTATLTVPAATICDGTVQNLNVALTGVPPYSFDIYDGIQYTSYNNIMTNNVNIPLAISATTTYSITSLTDANCVGYLQDYGQPVTVTVNPRPTAVLTGSDVICYGNSTSAMNVTLTGAAPWNFNYFDGNSTVGVANVMSSPHTLVISPSITASYNLVSVTDANGCSAYGTDMSGTGNVVVNYAPNILSQTNGFNACSGANAVFSVNVTGTNLVYQWTENGVPISNGGVYAGANSPTLQISDITGLNGRVYVLNVSGICPPAVSSTPITLNESTSNQWAGTSDVNWSNTSNWSCGILPTAATDVTIMPSAPHQPIVDIPTAICKSLLIYPGSSVLISGNGNALEVKANIINLGSFDAHLGKLIVSGSGAQNVPGVIYKDFEVLGGSNKTFSGNAVVTNNLYLYSGYIMLGQNNLVLGQNAVVNGASPSSFVVTNGSGVVVGEEMGAGANTGTVLFPVGSNANSYTPVMISNSGMADDINVKVIDGVWEHYNNNVPVGSPLTAGSVSKTWLIHETIPGGSNATITPQWNFTEHLTGFNTNSCGVSHYVGENWVPGPLSSAAGFSPYTQSLTGVTSFSPFGVASSGPLGLNLLSFKGNLVNEDSRLSWVTTTEKDMKVYEVERSTDKGASYQQIGKVAATGNGKSGNNNYSYVDAGAAKLGADRILYRLRMVETGGKNSYSNVVAVTVGKEVVVGNIDLYPNPVTGNDLYIRMGESKGDDISVVVTDMSGRVISTTEYKANSYNVDAVKVDVSQLAQGVYLLRIVNANNTAIETLKFNRQ